MKNTNVTFNDGTQVSVIAIALLDGLNIADTKTARINAVNTSPDIARDWVNAVTRCQKSFYDYQKYVVDSIIDGISDHTRTRITTDAYADLRVLIDMIGDINGYKLEVSADLLNKLSELVYSDKKKLSGEAQLLASKIRNTQKLLKEQSPHSVNYADNCKKLNDEIEHLKDKLKAEKTLLGSAESEYKPATLNTFRNKLELRLGMFVNAQRLIPREVLEAQKKAEAEARKAARKAKRQAQRQAEAQAKAQ